MAEKKEKFKERLGKLKESGLPGWRILLSIVLFLGGLVLFSNVAGKIGNPLLTFLAFFLFMQLLAVLIDLAQGLVVGIIPFLKTFLRYCLSTFLEILLLFLILPIVLLEMLAGPLMIMVLVLSGVGLGIYFLKDVLKMKMGSLSSFENATQVTIAVIAFLISGFVLFQQKRIAVFIDFLVDKAKDLIASLYPQHQDHSG